MASFLRSISMAVRRNRPSSSSLSSRSRPWRPEMSEAEREVAKGNALIAGGVVIMCVAGYRIYVDQEATLASNSIWDELEDLERTRRLNEQEKRRRVLADPSSHPRAPELYRARITKDISARFNGPLALQNVRVGEIVSVLEEDVGPSKQYYRTRSLEVGKDGDKTEREGWYPKKYLEKEFSFDGAVRFVADELSSQAPTRTELSH